MVFQAEAEVRWLDHCETSLVRYQPAAHQRQPRTADPADLTTDGGEPAR